MTLSARSDIAGVESRFEILLATTVGGQTRGAGFVMDLVNGTSLIRLDADKVVFTAPGGTGGAGFSYDAGTGTLSVPNLRLTSGQASMPLSINIPSYTLIAGAGTVNGQIDANLNFTYNNANPDYPTTIEIFGKLTISGPTGTALQGMRMLVDGVVVGFFRFNEQTAGPIAPGGGGGDFDFRCSCLRYFPAGNRNVRISYNYTSPGAGQVQINELHLVGLQPKA